MVFDLDNTLADFSGAGGIEKMYERGFFAGLKPYPNAIETLELLNETAELFILSACIDSGFCRDEKLEWIERYLPFIKKENIILIDIGLSKAIAFTRTTKKLIDEDCILFDDYGRNLEQWHDMGGTAIKCGKMFKRERPFKQLIKFENIHEVLA